MLLCLFLTGEQNHHIFFQREFFFVLSIYVNIKYLSLEGDIHLSPPAIVTPYEDVNKGYKINLSFSALA